MRTGLLYTTIAALAALTFPACSDDGAGGATALPGATSTSTNVDGTLGASTTTSEENVTTDVIGSTSSPGTTDWTTTTSEHETTTEVIDPSSTSSTTDESTTLGTTENGDTTTGGPVACLQPGHQFGPCIDGACAPGLFCTDTAQGSVCQPACVNGACPGPCADAFNTMCDLDGACIQPCRGPEQCLEGQVCDLGIGECVWPKAKACIEPGEAFGSCEEHACADGLVCTVTKMGTTCNPMCVDGQCDTPCVGIIGTECLGDGRCVQSCASSTQCQGGSLCDKEAGICVWTSTLG